MPIGCLPSRNFFTKVWFTTATCGLRGGVALREGAAHQHARSHGVKEPGAHRAVACAASAHSGSPPSIATPVAPVVERHRPVGRIRRVMQSGNRGKGLVDLPVEALQLFILVARRLEIDEGDQPALRLKVEVLLLQPLQADDQQPRRAQQSDRERCLQDDQDALQRTRIAGAAVARCAEHLRDWRARQSTPAQCRTGLRSTPRPPAQTRAPAAKDLRSADRSLRRASPAPASPSLRRRQPPAPARRPAATAPRDSTSISRTSRERDAPSAVRTLSSCRRATPRTSIRFARFAHAISSTNPAIICSIFRLFSYWSRRSLIPSLAGASSVVCFAISDLFIVRCGAAVRADPAHQLHLDRALHRRNRLRIADAHQDVQPVRLRKLISLRPGSSIGSCASVSHTPAGSAVLRSPRKSAALMPTIVTGCPVQHDRLAHQAGVAMKLRLPDGVADHCDRRRALPVVLRTQQVVPQTASLPAPKSSFPRRRGPPAAAPPSPPCAARSS